MELDEIAAFVAVADAGGFTAAARAVRIPKSSLSRRVAALEARLGGALFRRSTRHFSLTDLGASLHARCQAPVRELQAATSDLVTDDGELVGRCRITAPGAVGRHLLAPGVGALLAENPRLACEINLVDRRVNLVEEGFDLALRIGTLEDSTALTSRRVGDIRRVLCAAPAYLERAGTPASLGDLARFEGLGSVAGQNVWEFGTAGIAHPSVRFVANDIELLRIAALRGQGLAVLPRFLVAEDLAQNRLTQVLQGTAPNTTQLTALWSARPLSRAMRVLIDRLVAQLVD